MSCTLPRPPDQVRLTGDRSSTFDSGGDWSPEVFLLSKFYPSALRMDVHAG